MDRRCNKLSRDCFREARTAIYIYIYLYLYTYIRKEVPVFDLPPGFCQFLRPLTLYTSIQDGGPRDAVTRFEVSEFLTLEKKITGRLWHTVLRLILENFARRLESRLRSTERTVLNGVDSGIGVLKIDLSFPSIYIIRARLFAIYYRNKMTFYIQTIGVLALRELYELRDYEVCDLEFLNTLCIKYNIS